jgi:hypothetical protein
MHEYVVLRPRQPVAAPGPYEHAGIWLKGNSGWGEVMWEIEDAKGGKWLSQSVTRTSAGRDGPGCGRR